MIKEYIRKLGAYGCFKPIRKEMEGEGRGEKK